MNRYQAHHFHVHGPEHERSGGNAADTKAFVSSCMLRMSRLPRPIESDGCVATRRKAYSLSRLNSVRPAWRRLASDPMKQGTGHEIVALSTRVSFK